MPHAAQEKSGEFPESPFRSLTEKEITADIFHVKKEKKSSIGCLFWIALILLVLVVFLFSRKNIEHVIESTGLLDRFKKDGQTTEQIEEAPEAEPTVPETPDTDPQTISTPQIEKNEETVPLVIKVQENTEEQAEEESADTEPVTKSSEQTLPASSRTRVSRLYFMNLETNEVSALTRNIPYNDSPLTETIEYLLQGLSAEELNSGFLSVIPENTRLLGISVSKGIATIDFSTDFTYNKYGKEGYEAQLRQVVYTATEFSTVDRVLVKINGKVHTYLSPEGLRIDKPIGREDL